MRQLNLLLEVMIYFIESPTFIIRSPKMGRVIILGLGLLFVSPAPA